jgi:hypothetical protein
VEHEEQAERMERDAERMEEESERVGGDIDDARREWESKEQDPSVPGAQPESEEEEESVPGAEADEETHSDEGVTDTPRRESDQLPEEGPADQVPDDQGGREHAEDSPGVPGEEETATGNPDAAGADDE